MGISHTHQARKAMQEQLQINKDLTQKIVVLSDDEHESKGEELETVPDFVNDPEPIIDSVNPWMKGQLTREEPEVSCITPEDAQTAEEENKEEELLGEFERKRRLRQADEEGLTPTEEKGMRPGLKKIVHTKITILSLLIDPHLKKTKKKTDTFLKILYLTLCSTVNDDNIFIFG